MFPVVWDKEDEVRERFLKGDLTVHMWNPEVAKRMREYQPDVLGLDSLPAGFEGGAVGGIWWPWLPAGPKEMNGKDRIYVVGGDVLHQSLLVEGEHEGFREDLGKAGWGKVEEYAKVAGAEFFGTGLLALVGLVAQAKFDGRLGRRTFLGKGLKAIGAAALAVTLGRMAPLVHSYSSMAQFSEFLQQITEVTKFRVASSVWLDGRTALLIAKTEDAMNALSLPAGAKASVVMGFPHAYEASPLLADKEKRAQKMREYALELERDLFPAIVRQGWVDSDDQEDREYIRNVILGIMSLSDIYEVQDPGVDKTDKPFEVIQNSVKLIKHYKSPEVVEALVPLGDPLKEVDN